MYKLIHSPRLLNLLTRFKQIGRSRQMRARSAKVDRWKCGTDIHVSPTFAALQFWPPVLWYTRGCTQVIAARASTWCVLNNLPMDPNQMEFKQENKKTYFYSCICIHSQTCLNASEGQQHFCHRCFVGFFTLVSSSTSKQSPVASSFLIPEHRSTLCTFTADVLGNRAQQAQGLGLHPALISLSRLGALTGG